MLVLFLVISVVYVDLDHLISYLICVVYTLFTILILKIPSSVARAPSPPIVNLPLSD